MDNKISLFSTQVAGAMNTMEDRWGTRIAMESEERMSEMRETRAQIEQLAARIANVEAGKIEAPKEALERGETTGGWRPAHLFLGFEPNSERGTIEGKAKELLSHMGDARKQCLVPWAFKRYGSIVKV